MHTSFGMTPTEMLKLQSQSHFRALPNHVILSLADIMFALVELSSLYYYFTFIVAYLLQLFDIIFFFAIDVSVLFLSVCPVSLHLLFYGFCVHHWFPRYGIYDDIENFQPKWPYVNKYNVNFVGVGATNLPIWKTLKIAAFSDISRCVVSFDYLVDSCIIQLKNKMATQFWIKVSGTEATA